MDVVSNDKNITIQYTQPVRPYHKLIADLAVKYGTKDDLNILDIGCGVGHTLAFIDKQKPASKFTIVDLDPKCLEITESRVNVKEKILFESAKDIHNIEGKFDIIVISHTLHYDSDPHLTMKKLLNLLSEEGVIILASPNPVTPTNFLNIVLKRHFSQGAYFWDMPTFQNFLKKILGAQVLEITHDYVPLPIIHKYKVFYGFSRFLASIFPWLSFSLIAVVKK